MVVPSVSNLPPGAEKGQVNFVIMIVIDDLRIPKDIASSVHFVPLLLGL